MSNFVFMPTPVVSRIDNALRQAGCASDTDHGATVTVWVKFSVGFDDITNEVDYSYQITSTTKDKEVKSMGKFRDGQLVFDGMDSAVSDMDPDPRQG